MVRYEGNHIVLSGDDSRRFVNRILGRDLSGKQINQYSSELGEIQITPLSSGLIADVPGLTLPEDLFADKFTTIDAFSTNRKVSLPYVSNLNYFEPLSFLRVSDDTSSPSTKYTHLEKYSKSTVVENQAPIVA